MQPGNYAVAFASDGRTLTVVVARQEGDVTSGYSKAARDTVFMWNMTSSGTVHRAPRASDHRRGSLRVVP